MSERGEPSPMQIRHLLQRYRRITKQRRLGGHSGYRFRRLLGVGGEGRVYLTHYSGADGFGYEAAVKVFSPEPYLDVASYDEGMKRMAHVASLVAQGNRDNLMGVLRFEQSEGIRLMLMEFLDGFDVRRVLSVRRHQRLQSHVADELWREINTVVVMGAEQQLRLTPGVAVNIIRDCLNGLDWLHRQGIVHGDIKPANMMLCRTGKTKIVDLGSAFLPESKPRQRMITRAYAAPEVLLREPCTTQSDLASLGYVLIELLAGQRLFDKQLSTEQLIQQKRELPRRLSQLLPPEVAASGVLTNLCQGLVHPDPAQRFESAERAHLDPARGAHQFLQELVIGRLGSAFEHHLARWIQAQPAGSRDDGNQAA